MPVGTPGQITPSAPPAPAGRFASGSNWMPPSGLPGDLTTQAPGMSMPGGMGSLGGGFGMLPGVSYAQGVPGQNGIEKWQQGGQQGGIGSFGGIGSPVGPHMGVGGINNPGGVSVPPGLQNLLAQQQPQNFHQQLQALLAQRGTQPWQQFQGARQDLRAARAAAQRPGQAPTGNASVNV